MRRIIATGSNIAGSDWRETLVNYALDLRLRLLAGEDSSQVEIGPDSELSSHLDKILGPMAQEAIRIVESFTLGTVDRERRGGKSSDVDEVPPPEFTQRLHIILNGLEPDIEAVSEEDEEQPGVIQSELWQLLYKVRESAELAYARELDLVELDRRILFLLSNVGPLVPAEISSAVGVDKAQVSRSVKRLLEIAMVERDQLRAPLKLTRKGKSQAERLLRLAEMRNRELTFDIPDEELEEFFAGIEKLLDQAVLLYEQERKQANSGDADNFPRPGAAVESDSPANSGGRLVLDRTRIISPLMTLSSYFSRSGSLTFKRMTNLSNFEAWVLNEIGHDTPIEWNVLVERLDRDHSQAGRTLKVLIDKGLIVREGKPGRRHGRFSPSAEGQELWEIIQQASRQRSNFLLAPLSTKERSHFLSTFDKIRRNATVQLERERTFEELGEG